MVNILDETLMKLLEKIQPQLVDVDGYSPAQIASCYCSGNCGQSCSGDCAMGCSGDCGRSCSGCGN